MPEGLNTNLNEEREKSLRMQISHLEMGMGTLDRTIQAETEKKGSESPDILQLRIAQDTNTVRLKNLNDQLQGMLEDNKAKE